jgi:murein DD-endopeptidase MepM/ murein hydrolase activator NlpD
MNRAENIADRQLHRSLSRLPIIRRALTLFALSLVISGCVSSRYTPAPVEIYRPGMSSKSQAKPSKNYASPLPSNRRSAFETITYEPSPLTLSAPSPTESGHKVSITELPPTAMQAPLAQSISKPTQPLDTGKSHENDFGIKPEKASTPSQAPNPLEVIDSLQEEDHAPAPTEPVADSQVSQAEQMMPPSAKLTAPAIPATPNSNQNPQAKPSVETTKPAPTTINMGGLSFVWPIVGPTVAPFGPTTDGLHNDGINIKARKGSPVRAAESGTVVFVGEKVKGFGQLLLIKHKSNFTTAYAHTQKILVKKKDTVKRGQVVAYSGDSGSVKFPQLHFELRSGVKPIDPTPYLAQQ